MEAEALLARALDRYAEGQLAEARTLATAALGRHAEDAAATRLVRFLDEIAAAVPAAPGFDTGGWLIDDWVAALPAELEPFDATESGSIVLEPIDDDPTAGVAVGAVPPPPSLADLHAPDDFLEAEGPATAAPTLEDLVGSLQLVPTVALDIARQAAGSVDPRAAFLVSRIDGATSFEQLLDLARMPRDEATRILARLVEAGILRAQ